MPISDPRYVLLVVLVAAGFYILPVGRSRMMLLLCVSYLYYLTFPLAFFPALLFVTATAFVGGLLIQRADGRSTFRWITAACLLVCFTPMLVYKYALPLFGLVADGVGGTAWILPVGLSFYTFAAAGYLADVALGVVEAERRPLRLALFCGFFPTVTMGPVMRTSLFEELQLGARFDVDRWTRALSEILLGAVLKLWFADTLAGIGNSIYSDVMSSSPVEQFVGSIFVAFQVYADWLGYSMIAIGSARLFGVDLPENFRQPFLAPTMNEFWRRWNISLINWLRDYVFTPIRLKLKSLGALSVPLATMITFVVLGIWHAAGWGYLVYGAVNGFLVICSQLTLPFRDRFYRAVGCPAAVVRVWRAPITFLIVVLTVPLVCARDFGQVVFIYQGIFSARFVKDLATAVAGAPGEAGRAIFHHHPETMGIGVILITCLVAYDILAATKAVARLRRHMAVAVVVYSACVLAILYQAISPNVVQPFVYFRY